NMAEMEFGDGHPEEALKAATEALEIDLRGKNAMSIAADYTNIAAYRIALNNFTEARDLAREALRVALQARIEVIIAVTFQHLAMIAALRVDARSGALLLGYTDAQYAALGMQRGPTEQWGYDKLTAALRETLSADEIATLGAEGAA